jgi:transcriptional regulator with XRE-family HTH domain
VPDSNDRGGLYPALLKHWRRQRGLSQLDLAVTADVSARHVSFLETGRSVPSAEMVVQLAMSLSVPLHHVNAMLRAAGHSPLYDESDEPLPAPVSDALTLLKAHHEPFPLVIVNRTYDVLDLNLGALDLFEFLLGGTGTGNSGDGDGDGDGDHPAEQQPLNLARLTFDPDGAQPHLANFDQVGRELLWRIHREVLADPDDRELRQLLDDLLAMPTVDADWRQVDLLTRSEPALVLHLRRNDLELRFLTLVTAFQAPQNVTVEDLRIETWFPYDTATADACSHLASHRLPRSEGGTSSGDLGLRGRRLR